MAPAEDPAEDPEVDEGEVVHDAKMLFAFLISIFGCFCHAVAYIMMKTAHIRREKRRGSYSLCCDGLWCAAFGILWIATGVDVWAMAWGNETLIACTMATTNLFNTVLSIVFLKESWSKVDLIAILLICISSTCFLLIIHDDDRVLDNDDLLYMYLSP